MSEAHLMYSRKARKVMESYLSAGFSQEKTGGTIKKEEIYRSFLQDLPQLGGKKNYQAQSFYDCVGLLALYEAVDPKPGLQEFEDLVSALFVPGRKLPLYANMNWSIIKRITHGIFSRFAGKAQKHRQQWTGNYHMEVQPHDKTVSIRYCFTTCPIADFAKAHNCSHLMSAVRNPNYPTLAAMYVGMIRTRTCAQDNCCDHWILGDRDPQLSEHPVYRDEKGFLRNQ